MYARPYGCYARPDATAVTRDWDMRAQWLALLEDIREHYSIRWWVPRRVISCVREFYDDCSGTGNHKKLWNQSPTAPSRGDIRIRSTISSPTRSGLGFEVSLHPVRPPPYQPKAISDSLLYQQNLQRPRQRDPQPAARNSEYSGYGEAFPFIPMACDTHGL